MRKLAEKRHAGQFRKGCDRVPYIVHPQAVVQNLLDRGEVQSSDAVMMAWGHDLPEDSDATQEEILASSNENTLNGILLLTHVQETPKPLCIRNVAGYVEFPAGTGSITDNTQMALFTTCIHFLPYARQKAYLVRLLRARRLRISGCRDVCVFFQPLSGPT